jgi:hypothetical protein
MIKSASKCDGKKGLTVHGSVADLNFHDLEPQAERSECSNLSQAIRVLYQIRV